MLSGICEVVCGLRHDLYSEFYVTVVKAFIDDSGSGGDSPWFVLAGYIGSIVNWDAFDGEWQSVLDQHPKIEYFKSAEAESLRGEFSGFTAPQRNARVDALIRVIQARASQAIHVRVKQKNYIRIVKANGIPPAWDDAYYFLFPAVLSAFVGMEKYGGSGDPIEFIFDSNERVEKPSRTLYGQLANAPLFAGRIANVNYRDEKKFLPLQAADLLAWQARRRFCVHAEPKRPQFEAAQKCCGPYPCFSYTLTEGDLWKAMYAMRDRDQDWAIAHGLPPDTEVWKLLGKKRPKLKGAAPKIKKR